jgi:hypothetical protein
MYDTISISCRSILALVLFSPWQLAGAKEVPTYHRDVRPILADHCFACHGPDSAARKADLRLDVQQSAHETAVIPGDADESELILRVTTDDLELWTDCHTAEVD